MKNQPKFPAKHRPKFPAKHLPKFPAKHRPKFPAKPGKFPRRICPATWADRHDAGATKLTPCLLAAGGGTLQPNADQTMTVYIEDAAVKVTKRYCSAGDMAEVLGIDTSVIPDFDKNALCSEGVYYKRKGNILRDVRV
jgi:hypothetical protein